MTHLRIEQNNGVIEEVSTEIIEKLYNIIYNGQLDDTSNLIGRLHTSATYQDYIDYLENTFKINGVKQLIVDATNKYIRLADPEVQRVLTNNWGDGIGVTLTDISTKSQIEGSMFKNNSTITQFNELGTMSNITRIGQNAFDGCTNLVSINLQNITRLDSNAFARCTSLTYINLPNIATVGAYAFQNINNSVIDLGSSLQSLPNDLLKNEWAGTFIMRCNSVPTLHGNFIPRQYWKSNIYVPDEVLDTFKQDSNWSQVQDRIHPLSEYEP